ncbi:hypothetical protein F5884DRAFT_825476 [Xylogone sp. PMI_703]|nr:hypothetical protein F5884DRAFT_825476 [Xylogone sp. PMI_703]
MADLKEIAVIGGTALSQSGRYRARVLTRNLESSRAKQLAALPNVVLLQGSQDNQQDLHNVFRGVYGAWVNLDGVTLGEKDELFYGFRAYEIARSERVQHYIWAHIEYALENANFDEKYHCGHMESKGRVGKFILSLGQEGMKSTLFSTGPYMDMLMDGMFVPMEQFEASDTKLPLNALCDVGVYNLWILDNPSKSTGMDLSVETDNISFGKIAKVFTEITGKRAAHMTVPWEKYASVAEPYPGARVNWVLGPDAARDEFIMTWRENFGAWWQYWGDGITKPRNTTILDRIHPKRIKSLNAWMEKVGYDGKRRSVLKMVDDWAEKSSTQKK